ncbi:N-formylglutamate amidohydrolase [Salinarimonas sp. NSM]|uniref:N-formylglutamate amidohydrolase n=1 Tax=Salinarimonas sp. NSM TaxID=3458003 RepID=UPI004036053F
MPVAQDTHLGADLARDADLDPDFAPAFVVDAPGRQSAPFVFNAPHAGTVYPPAFLAAARLSGLALRRSEDAHVDALFAGVPALGAPLLRARFPRAYLDVNREPYELDPRMFDGRLPGYANTRSMRVAGGLGTIPRLVADGHEIYARKLAVEEGLARVEALYKPYHRTLRRLVERTVSLFGAAVLIDCHSMPSSSLAREEMGVADIVLGDRYGTSCAGPITDLVEEALRRRGYGVARNKPYAGGFITEHYGEPAGRRHALQIEINRALYMDERTLARSPAFATIARDLIDAMAEVFPAIASCVGAGSIEPGLAAE